MLIREVCPQCQSSKYKKNGHIHNGKQKGHACGATPGDQQGSPENQSYRAVQ